MTSLAATQTVPDPPGILLRTAAEAIDPRQLFDSHLAFVWRNLRRLGVPDALVEDAAQDVFLVVHRRWDSWHVERCTVETWLFGIVLRVARNYRRAQQRRLAWLQPACDPKLLQETPSLADGPAEILAQREAVVVFERALVSLDQAKRALFLMVDVEQMTVPQASSALGINVNTAYWRLRKARLAFRRALGKLRAQAGRLDGRNRP
ncbi:MAG: sigma-70 family RNA polymerase sigma factor [Deltaproteobacteria bacterium]|jgi:RNA polymerase sigma-70 factor (ECF subfamily)|nr:sigma-70 family RNA polymerase sigma factor [Deltaproteobacteria bacterium]